MTTPQLERMEIFRQIRVVLVRHMIDIGRLSIQISAHSINLHGSLRRLPGVTTELSSSIIRAIFSELGMIRGIRRVDGDFDNWRALDSAGSSWVPIQAKKIIESEVGISSAANLATPPPGVFDIPDADKADQPPK